MSTGIFDAFFISLKDYNQMVLDILYILSVRSCVPSTPVQLVGKNCPRRLISSFYYGHRNNRAVL
jgi:hypothetical protein